MTPRNQIITGDALTVLRSLTDRSIDQVLTSPPYFRLRSYDGDGQLGLEAHVDQWVDQLVDVAREVQRVLVPTGSFWLNLGDSYAAHGREGAARKSLLLGPERLALRLIADGWLLRNKIVWRKTNPMPTSVRDRLACTWEYLFVFSKQPQAFFDLDAVRLPHQSTPTRTRTTPPRGQEVWRGPNTASRMGLAALKAAGLVGHPLGKNPGDIWQIASSNYRGSHRATFPLALAEQAVRAGCPETRCAGCTAPWRRRLVRTVDGTARRGPLVPACTCSDDTLPGLVLDPFMGAGTTALAAETLGRDWLGIELSTVYAAEASRRLEEARNGLRAAA